MPDIENWSNDALHTVPMVQRSFGAGRGRRVRIPIGTGYAAGLYLTVQFPDYFERISGRRGGWGPNSWSQIERVLERANQNMAETLQLMVVEALEEGRVSTRKDVSTGRLQAALLDPQNMVNTGRRFGVGNISFLNRSEAQYWRQIDSGTRVHVGQVLYGFWQEAGGRPHPHDRGRRSDRFVPAIGRVAGSPARPKSSIVGKGKIRNEIKQQQYFERAWKKFNPRNRALGALRQAVTEVLGVSMVGVRNSWDATISAMSS